MVEATNILIGQQVTTLLGIYNTQASQVLLNLVDASLPSGHASTIKSKSQQVIDTLNQTPNPTQAQIRDLAQLLYDGLYAMGILPPWKEN